MNAASRILWFDLISGASPSGPKGRRLRTTYGASEDAPFQNIVVMIFRKHHTHCIRFYLLSGSMGNMHSIRNSCAVMDCGVPTVVMNEK